MSRFCPFMAIVTISFFLTASFFVLFALRKVAEKWLKVFGYLTVSFLLLTALVVFSGAISSLAKGLGGMRCAISQKMKKCGMAQMMHQKNMPEETAIPEKGALPRK